MHSGVLVKLGFYIFLVFIGLPLYAFFLSAAGYLIAAAGATFGAAITANALSFRVFERMNVTAAGLGWRSGSMRHLGIGMAAGALAAAAAILLPVAVRVADFVPDAEQPASAASLLFVTVVLLFGAVGEELLFRGYGFQILIPSAGRAAALAISSALFGYVHMGNMNASPLGIVNTMGFGVVLGYAFLRSGDLWLPIGIHFGWNWILPLAGANLSGFKMGLSGYTMRWYASDLWSGGGYGPEGSVLACGAVVGLLVFLWKVRVTPEEPPLLAQRPQEEAS